MEAGTVLEWICKPGSVPGRPKGRPATIISLGRRLPAASSSLPESVTRRAATCRPEGRRPFCLALLPMGFAEPDRSPGLLVSSYLTVSPLPAGRTPQAVCFLWHFPWPRGRWALPTIAPYGARTFLPPALPPAGDHPVRSNPPPSVRRVSRHSLRPCPKIDSRSQFS